MRLFVDISRRDFLRVGALGTVSAVAGSAIPILPSAARVASTPPTAPLQAFELDELTIVQLQDAMRTGRYTSRRLCELYLARIDAVDRRGPTLRSVIETNPEALDIAARLDEERKAGRVRGPLHGIPVLIKDNIATADRMETTAGSLALVGLKPPRDAFLAERLRAAGAVILGKTNLSEWANFRSTRSISGWSGRGGLCRSPYALDRNPCGSSSGTGVAVAANLCAVGVGTETNGSIICPSAFNSLVGIKPTVGLVSRSGVIPIAHSQDTAGPMTRTVADAAALLGGLTGVDPRDGVTRESQGKAESDYTRFLDPSGLKGARIGVARARYFGNHPGTDKLVEQAIDVIRAQGAEVVDPADFPHATDDDGGAALTVLLYEFKTDLNAYLSDLGAGAPIKTLADLIAYNQAHAREEMPYFGQEIFEMAQKKGPLTDYAYVEALAKMHRFWRTEGLDKVLADHKLDAIVAPSGGPPSLTDLVGVSRGGGGGSSTPAAVSGYPNITVPAGYVFGLPVGISFMGAPYSEGKLIRLAYAYEQASKHRQPPRFLPTADVRVG